MGGPNDERRERTGRVFGMCRTAMLASAITLLSASAALPDATENRNATPVSTSPSPSKAANAPEVDPKRSSSKASRPLTRAAALSHIEAISPVAWLNRFGRVEIENRK